MIVSLSTSATQGFNVVNSMTVNLRNMADVSTVVRTRTVRNPTLPVVNDANGTHNTHQANGAALPNDANHVNTTSSNEAYDKNGEYVPQLVWRNLIFFIYVHLCGLYGAYLLLSCQSKFLTVLFVIIYGGSGGLGITAGAHRLWAHRSYKAKWQLRLILGIFQTIAFQNHIFEWSRDHRVHHKFSESDADPHNAKRGFFFSHVGWLIMRKHPDVRIKGKCIDMSDLEKDWVVVWQRRFYLILMPLFTFIIPTIIPIKLWGEDPWIAWYATLFRWTTSLNCTWLVNSAAHMWGNKPYDKSISPAENLTVAFLAYGEGFHNYHHVFPFDYKAAELGNYGLNPTTAFIDFFSRIGWAYDMKTISDETIRKRVARTGDGTHKEYATNNATSTTDRTPEHEENKDKDKELVWGWDDKDLKDEDRSLVTILKSKE